MAEIILLNQETIDKIAAGEVIERPSSVVKELIENSMDAGATAITVEIKDGGTSLIRITDNGLGIEKDQVPIAFLRHSTSKIKSVEDLLTVSSLGFRGEALSSIAAVARVELITKTVPQLTGIRYVIEGSVEKEKEEIGAPDGTTFLVRDLFYNTPARRKFLKTAQTEAGYINTLVERLALSRPDISFKLIINNQIKLHTSGNSNAKDVIYQIYGRDITSSLIEINDRNELFEITGFIGKPEVSRGNRNFEHYFINRRYIKSSLIAKSLEDGYKNFLMQHQYPFCVLYFNFDGQLLDVNVHPTKMELRFSRNEEIYQKLYTCIRENLIHRDHIKSVSIGENSEKKKEKSAVSNRQAIPEPFEKKRMEQLAASVRKDSPYEPKYTKEQIGRNRSTGIVAQSGNQDQDTSRSKSTGLQSQTTNILPQKELQSQTANILPQKELQSQAENILHQKELSNETANLSQINGLQNRDSNLHQFKATQNQQTNIVSKIQNTQNPESNTPQPKEPQNSEKNTSKTPDFIENPAEYIQEEIQYEGKFLSEQARKQHKIIGQVFDTYWLVEYDGKLFIIDQHAAHEKVLYERTLSSLKNRAHTTQMISPPVILTLDPQEEEALSVYQEQLQRFGFEIEPFGGKEYAVCGVPGNLFDLNPKQILLEILDSHEEIKKASTPELVLEKIASMSCKAAVKGNHTLKRQEAETLIAELLELENPYFCPHGRPTIIAMTKQELEKKFKRIV